MRYKDSITFDAAEVDDSNPEGINQYTGGGGGGSSEKAKEATEKATAASNKAYKGKSGKTTHREVAQAHREAAQVHREAAKVNAGSKGRVEHHNKRAAEHEAHAKTWGASDPNKVI
jgi:hypothetical protein